MAPKNVKSTAFGISVHTESVLEIVPSYPFSVSHSQSKTLTDPVGEREFVGHDSPDVLPVSVPVQYLLTGHVLQLVCPAELKVPATHSKITDAFGQYEPAVHACAVEDPAGQYVPLGHSTAVFASAQK